MPKSDGRAENEHSYAAPVLWRNGSNDYLITHGNDYAIAHRHAGALRSATGE